MSHPDTFAHRTPHIYHNSLRLSDYAFDMAKRLNFELGALNVTSTPLSLSGDKQEAAIAAFVEGAQQSVTE